MLDCVQTEMNFISIRGAANSSFFLLFYKILAEEGLSFSNEEYYMNHQYSPNHFKCTGLTGYKEE